MKKTLLSELLSEIQMDFSKSGNQKGGRRFVPDKFDIPLSKIKDLNNISGGPHIRLFKSGDKTVLGVSQMLYIAMGEMQRGRTSRSGEIYKRPLLKRFSEIFEDEPQFRGALKNSVQNQRSQKTPFGDLFISDLEVELNKETGILSVKNPAKSKSEDGLDESNEGSSLTAIAPHSGEEFEVKAVEFRYGPGGKLYGVYVTGENPSLQRVKYSKYDEWKQYLSEKGLTIDDIKNMGIKIDDGEFDPN